MKRHAGLTLLEVLISAFILSILSVSVIHGLTTLELESHVAESRMVAVLLAADLREEILSKPTVDPDGRPQFGREEVSSPDDPGRIGFDDQDDYAGLTDRPATNIGGTALTGMDRFWRSVKIDCVSPLDPSVPADTSPHGLRRYTVAVYKDQTELAHLMWLGYGQDRPSKRESVP